MRIAGITMAAWAMAVALGLRLPAQDEASTRDPPNAGAVAEAADRLPTPFDTEADGDLEGIGTVEGVVQDADKKDEPVSGATVEVEGTSISTTTDGEGRFVLENVPAGRRKLKATRGFEYEALPFPVDVKAGGNVTVTLALVSSKGKKMVVTGRLKASKLSKVLPRFDVGTKSVIPREELAQQAGGSAVEGVRNAPGVSTVDKYAYVRGLGGRYSQTLINGGSIPSPEPDKREIPLDLFPTNLIDNLAVVKTFSPDMPGEFSGGSVQINTVGVPTESFASAGMGFKYRDGTTLKDFDTYQGGNLDMFSFDDGTRSLPGDVPKEFANLTPKDVQSIGRSFKNIWDIDVKTAPFDHKINLSFGERIPTGKESAFGIVGALTWGNKYQTVRGEARRIVGNSDRENPKPFVFSDYKLDTGTFEAELSSVLNLTYEFNRGQKVGIRNLYTRASEDQTRVQTGIDGQKSLDEPIYRTRLRYVDRSLFITQPFGQHLLAGDTLLEWRASYALSQRDEPDNRQMRYLFDSSKGRYEFDDLFGSGQREFYQLDENIYDAAVDYSIPFRPFVEDREASVGSIVPEQKIKFGPSAVFRNRDFNTRLFRFRPSGSGNIVDEQGRPIDISLPPDLLFQPGNINPNGFVLTEVTRSSDNYKADQTLLAAYVMADFRLHEDWQLMLGARIENSIQKVETTGTAGPGSSSTEADLETTDVLPAFSLVWDFVKDMQLRLSGSRTVSRPEFRELAPFQYTDLAGGYTAQGNPDLERALLWNGDLGLSWFPALGDVLSVGAFYKRFESPIEVVNIPTGSTLLTTWSNADSADLYGVEFEARKNFDFLEDLFGLRVAPGPTAESRLIRFKDFNLIGSFALMDSEVRIPDKPPGDGPQFQFTNKKRALQGMSNYLLNVGFLFDSPRLGLTLSVLANTFGERISAIGSAGLDDEKEEPRWNLEVSIAKKIGKGTIKLTAENILDEPYEYEQSGITTREYSRGFVIGLAYSYSF